MAWFLTGNFLDENSQVEIIAGPLWCIEKMKIQDYLNIVALAKKEFDSWIRTKTINFKCLQFVFPFVETDKEITTWIFFLKDENINEYIENGTVDLIKSKFKNLLIKHNLPGDVIDIMKFEVDSDENVQTNFEGNYFYRLR